ncbi:uncharacterized protein SAPINGB_P004182 [Magnusiomyces paraingens]|uniref:F-actin-capping protein subunit alpha n=1 Tax=Magnusiomyces paraingens TaxID=2606893 RepID=A0A5E8BY65_9ASCO|nr:uncharacterized protein SAPINGB_P004182 [Saprochaete ingens]VVT54650.1 unnamed protein product [Saprochaete ingens]
MASEFAAKVIADAPPGELSNVLDDLDILSQEASGLTRNIETAVAKYNVDQFTIVTLEGSKKTVLSPFNQAEDLFFDPVLKKQFEYDHLAKKATNVSSYSTDVDVDDLHDSVSRYVAEHFPSSSGFGVFPQPDQTIAIVIVDSKYSAANYWNGRWRSWYLLDPASGSISGSVELDIHYFEDGNVRLTTRKEIGFTVADAKDPPAVVAQIANYESEYQEELNRALVGLNEGPFKALRRQLPVTRSKMNWGSALGNYRLGKDIGGAN